MVVKLTVKKKASTEESRFQSRRTQQNSSLLHSVQASSKAHAASYLRHYEGYFPRWQSGRGAKLPTLLLMQPGLRRGAAKISLTLCLYDKVLN